MLELPYNAADLLMWFAVCYLVVKACSCSSKKSKDETMANPVPLTVGDTRTPLRAQLSRPDGTPADLTGTTVVFLMVEEMTGVIKVDRQAAVVDTPLSGLVSYEWKAADVDEAGRYYGWFIVSQATLDDTFPVQGRTFEILFRRAA